MYKLNFKDDCDVVFTSYFTSKRNPQPDLNGCYSYAPADDISYIYSWYVSVLYLKLKGVIIHDGLSEEFINKYETSNIKFIKHVPERFSINDERYIALERILENNYFRNVLLTDGSDLIIKKNPFDFMINQDCLYFGSDDARWPRIRDNAWCVNKSISMYNSNKSVVLIDDSFLDFNYVNAGVFGGSYKNVKEFTSSLSILFECINNDNNNNMMAINYLLWKFNVNHFKGQPFTSKFKEYELHGNYFIVHK
jgi:hypothetical protein